MAVDWNAAIVTWLISEVYVEAQVFTLIYVKKSLSWDQDGPRMMQDTVFIHPVFGSKICKPLRQSRLAMDADFKCGIWGPKHVSRQGLKQPLSLDSDSFGWDQRNKRETIHVRSRLKVRIHPNNYCIYIYIHEIKCSSPTCYCCSD